MPRKCRGCLCRTCKEVCRCRTCKEKIKECKNYISCKQTSVFIQEPEKNAAVPRYSWKHYGITKERHKQLTEYIQSGRYASVVHSAAYTANKYIAEYILLSVMENRSYEDVENVEGIGRIPCGGTDFYGWRRYFYSVFDKMKTEAEINNSEGKE